MNLKTIKDRYLTEGHPTFFASPTAVYRYYKKQIPLSKIEKLLQSIETYTVLKQRHSKFRRNPHFLYAPRSLMEIDLVDVSKFSRP